ncbi:MAG: T9SS type A sorting domain-containing protein, partial [Bacteroidales bacterium]|nr:T9SS type A sorting domain-containing protein [Bacteroidales bacterium]
FPAGNYPVHLFSMPAALYADIDRDGVKDLLVSPFDPNPFLSENFHSIWYYRNQGTDDNPQFVLQTRSFLQDEMIDVGAGAYPVFHDFDGDGLPDLFIGNYGYYDTSYYDQYLTLYTEQTGMIGLIKNTGTAQSPSFNFIDRDFANVSALGLKGIMPTFGDINGDGATDMIIGCEDGTLLLFINQAAPGEPMDLVVSQHNYQGIDVGFYSAPQLFDFDRDGLPDLIIGERGGNLNYYRNTGTLQNPVFSLVTDSLGKVNVTDYSVSLYGFSTPYFFRDTGDRTHLLVGSEQGEILYYTGIDEAGHTGAFKRSDTLAALIGLQELKTKFGYRIAAALADLTGDGVPELVVGNFSGGLEYFGKNDPPYVSGMDERQSYLNLVQLYPQPARNMLNISISESYSLHSSDVLDISGRILPLLPVINGTTLQYDVSGLSSGIYIIRLSLYDKSSCSQVIIYEKMLKIY